MEGLEMVDPILGLRNQSVIATLTFDTASLLIWGCFKNNQFGKILCINGIVCGVSYKTYRRTFRHHNDSKHTDKILNEATA